VHQLEIKVLVFSKFRSKAPLKKPKNINLSLRRAPWGTWWRVLDTL